MKKKRKINVLCQILCLFLLLTGVLLYGEREAKAGGDGVVVQVRLYCPYPEWTGEQIALSQKGTAHISSDKVGTCTATTIEYPVGVHKYGNDPFFDYTTLPIGTTFTLTSLDIPEGYVLDSNLPMSVTYTQSDYDSIIADIANGYQGLCELAFRVYVRPEGIKADLSKAEIYRTEYITYNGKPQNFKGELRYNNVPLVEGVDYIATCSNNIKVGTADVIFKGIGKFEGSQLKKTYRIYPIYINYGDKDVSVSDISDQKYTGKAVKPRITLKYKGKALTLNKDYTVRYLNNVKVGVASAKIDLKGNYGGNIILQFLITDKTTSKPLPVKGKTYTVGQAKYKVTKSVKSGGTVVFSKPISTKNRSFTIPAAVKINGYTFKVTEVASNAFRKNTALTSVTVGKYVQKIGNSVFEGCPKLKNIRFSGTYLKSVGKNAFRGIYTKASIKVPSSRLTSYKKLLTGKGQAKTVKITK